METQYRIEIQHQPADNRVNIALNGQLNAEALPELDRSIAEALLAHQVISIDLSEVTLVDRKAVEYFAGPSCQNVVLVNCPVYLQRWINKGR